MAFFKRLFGISETKKPADPDCWQVSGATITVDLDKAPELGKPGGAIRIEGDGLDRRVLLFMGDDGQYRAFHNRCACAGWRLDPQAGTSTVQCCTLGRSTYDYAGEVTKGSASHPVKTYNVEVDGQKITIELKDD